MMLAPTAADREQQAARQALQRRIEPLHQAFFEQRNYKSLIKSCEALLKKDPKSVEVRTFLAMAKQQIGEPREALAIMTSLVRESKPTDFDSALRYLKVALEQSSQLVLLVEAFEYALSRVPKAQVTTLLKEERLLFFFYYQLGDYGRAAKQTQRLRGLDADGAPRYAMWAVVAAYHQYLHAIDNGVAPQPLHLALAERTLARMATEGTLVSGEDMAFYCAVMQTAGKTADARALAEGPMGEKSFPFAEERHKFVAKLLGSLSDAHAALLQTHMAVIALSPDDWEAWEGAIETAQRLDQKQDAPAGGAEWERVLALARETGRASPGRRGPRLAALEMALRSSRVQRGVSSGNGENVATLLVDYFSAFGDRACFWGDCARYAVALDDASRDWALAQMRAQLVPVNWTARYALLDHATVARVLDDPNDPHRHKRDGRDAGKVDQWCPEDVARQSQMMRRVSVAKLELTLGAVREPAAVTTLCRDLYGQFASACALYRKQLQVTEEGPNDDMAIVVAHYLLQRLGRPLDAAAVCTAMLEQTPYAFQPKLLLIQIARSVGAYSYVKEVYRLLDIKYVQQDSMGHYTLYAAVQSGDVAWLTKLYDEADEWLALYVRRIPRDTFKCFENGKWTQIESFNRFALRCRGSWHMGALYVETLLCKMLLGGGASGWEPSQLQATVRAARDAGLVSGGRQSTEWIEEIVRLCGGGDDEDTGVGATPVVGAGAVPLSYNYDMRAEADYSAAALRSKSEWARTEWVVPAAERAWLRARARLVLLLEAQVLGSEHTAAACALAAQLTAHWTRTGALAESGGGDRLASRWCLAVAAAALAALPALAAVHTTPTAPSLTAAAAAIGAAADAVHALRAHIVGGGHFFTPGWAADVSYAAFQLLPLAALQVRVWRSLLPTKGARNRMDADCKALVSDVTARIRVVVEALHGLGDDLNRVCASGVPSLTSLESDGHPVLGERAPPLQPVYAKLELSWLDLSKQVRQAVAHAQAGTK